MKPFAARGVLPQMWKTTPSRKLSVEATISKDALASLDAAFTIHPRRFRKATKQIATLGPSCATFEMIEKLFLSGADVFRLNFSHGEHHEKEALIRLIREVEKKYNHPIAVLADLQVAIIFVLCSKLRKIFPGKCQSLLFWEIILRRVQSSE